MSFLTKSTYAAAVASAVAGVFGCAKPDIEGPELQDLYGPFEVLEGLAADRTSVDFSAGQRVGFSAKLSIRTDWRLEIIGLESGARKVIEGRERDINAAVAEWDGTITFAPLFGAEPCATRLTFVDYPDTLWGDTVEVLGVREAPEVALVLSDFENAAQPVSAFTEPVSTNLRATGTYYQNLFTSPPTFATVEPAQGAGFWVMSANHTPANIFICGAAIDAGSATTGSAAYLDLGTLNPEHVYFNALVYGFGDGNSRLQVGLKEDDNLDGTYDRFTEGAYNAEVPIDWVGWKVVSIRADAFLRSTIGGYGNNDATGRQDLDRILQVEFLLLAKEQTTGFVGHGLDFLNFTVYAPWQP